MQTAYSKASANRPNSLRVSHTYWRWGGWISMSFCCIKIIMVSCFKKLVISLSQRINQRCSFPCIEFVSVLQRWKIIDWLTLMACNPSVDIYPKRLRNWVHCTFIFTFFVQIYQKKLFLFCTHLYIKYSYPIQIICKQLYGWVGWFLFHINHCRLFNAKSSSCIYVNIGFVNTVCW